MTTWTWLQAELRAEDRLVTTMYEGAYPSHGAAHQAALTYLQRVADGHPGLAQLPADWAAGVEDDTISFGPFVVALVETGPDGDLVRAVQAWLDDLAAGLRDEGLEVTVAWPTQTQQ